MNEINEIDVWYVTNKLTFPSSVHSCSDSIIVSNKVSQWSFMCIQQLSLMKQLGI